MKTFLGFLNSSIDSSLSSCDYLSSVLATPAHCVLMICYHANTHQHCYLEDECVFIAEFVTS